MLYLRSLILFLFLIVHIPIHAQYIGIRPGDNWSIGISKGISIPTHKTPQRIGGIIGIQVDKRITPIFGFGFEGTTGYNTTGSYTAMDNIGINFHSKTNLTTWIFGYKGKPRKFEGEALISLGYCHFFGSSPFYNNIKDDTFTCKVGLGLNFTPGEKRAWTFSITPALVYSLEDRNTPQQTKFNINNASVLISFGLKYHFKSSNGKHHFTRAKLYDQTQIDALNAKIEGLQQHIKESENIKE